MTDRTYTTGVPTALGIVLVVPPLIEGLAVLVAHINGAAQ